MNHIHLIGPGGAGKSTLGAMLGENLGFQLIDLDEAFLARFANIGRYIGQHGYLSYAHENVELYCDLRRKAESNCIFVISSGFMCYPSEVHPRYDFVRKSIESQPTTVILIPSFEMEECIRLTVARQCAKTYISTCPEKEEAVIRSRFPVYMGLPCSKVETKYPPSKVMARVAEIWTREASVDTAVEAQYLARCWSLDTI